MGPIPPRPLGGERFVQCEREGLATWLVEGAFRARPRRHGADMPHEVSRGLIREIYLSVCLSKAARHRDFGFVLRSKLCASCCEGLQGVYRCNAREERESIV